MTSLNKDGVEAGWRSHDGSADPDIAGDALVQVCFRDGETAFGVMHDWDQNWQWADSEEGRAAAGAIIAWRPHPAPASPVHEGGEVVASEPLPDRLRSLVPHLQGEYPPHVLSDLGEAASVLEASQARIAELEAALEPFAVIAEVRDTEPYCLRADNIAAYSGLAAPLEGHFRAARKALQPNGPSSAKPSPT